MRDASQWRESLDEVDPCWDLFSYKSILTETRYLSRPLECLTLLKNIPPSTATPFDELHTILETVEKDAAKAVELLKDTIDMANFNLGLR